MQKLTDRDLLIAINSVHERGMRLHDLWCHMSQKTFQGRDGRIPTKEDIDKVYRGYKEHLALLEKLRARRGKA